MQGASESGLVTIGGAPQNGSFAASQYGTNFKLDASDGRVTSAAYDAAHNTLYAVFEAQTSFKSAPTVELLQYSPGSSSATLYSLNNLLSKLTVPAGYTTSGAATFNASVAVDGQGDLLVNFNVSGRNMLPADALAVWKQPTAGNISLAGGPSTVLDYKNSVSAYVDPSHDSVGRWGDYSTAVADPSAKNGFFISNEYENGTVLVGTNSYSSWGTVLAHYNVA
jgi:hypothetical protein